MNAISSFAERASQAPGLLIRDFSTKRTARPYAAFAPFYDLFLGDRFFPQLRRVFERLVRRYGIRYTSAADVACGTGSFVRYLRERGVPVVYGVDRSAEMLRMAMAKNRGNGARFLLQDFASLQLSQPVDLITSQFDSLNYLLTTTDLLQALRRFHANLTPGGHVLFDMVTDRPPWQGSSIRVERATGLDGTLERVTRWDPRRSLRASLVSISGNGRFHREIHVQRGYPVAMVVRLLARVPFNVLGVHDFHTLGPATSSTSRAVYVAGL